MLRILTIKASYDGQKHGTLTPRIRQMRDDMLLRGVTECAMESTAVCFSCKLDVEEKSWNAELGRMSGCSIVAQEANRMLDKIRVGISQSYQKISDRDNYVTVEKVRNAYPGLSMNHETLLAVFRQHNEDYEKQIGRL